MRKTLMALGMTAVLTVSSFAGDVPVLVMDSGTDFTHEFLKEIADPNIEEFNGSIGSDDDGNGYADDIYGWNFAENTDLLVHLDYTPPRYEDVMNFMQLMSKFQEVGKEGLSEAEFNFLVVNYNDKEFLQWVQFTGGWAHGSHVAGIIANNNNAIKMKAIAHIPVGNPPVQEIVEEAARGFLMSRPVVRGEEAKAPTVEEIVQYFMYLGQQNSQAIEVEAKYVGELAPRVINCSFGTENKALLANFGKVMVEQWGFENPTEEDVQAIVNAFVEYSMLPRDKTMFSYVPNALVVIAAGNSTENLDNITTSPNDVHIPNKIVVAATEGTKAIAGFSCFGTEKVDVAFSGVNIYSSYPNGVMGYMSGTSQAAPGVARVATLMVNENPDLTAVELKEILMKTVDKKSWLSDKVTSGGIVNIARAVEAAKYTASKMDVNTAIETVNSEIPDMPDMRLAPKAKMTDFEKEMYNSFAF